MPEAKKGTKRNRSHSIEMGMGTDVDKAADMGAGIQPDDKLYCDSFCDGVGAIWCALRTFELPFERL